MNRLNHLFETKKNNLLSIYFTAGYPALNTTLNIAEALEKAGADFLEIGFPYSDPVADGPVIQNSSQRSLENGMNLNVLFEELKDLRKRVTVPIMLMGYINPILQYGIEAFCKKAAEVGIDGIIVPDLPIYEYEKLYVDFFKKNNLSNIFMVTPQTSDDRIIKIDQLSRSFVYLLSASTITGVGLQLSDTLEGYYKRVKALNLKNPTIFGFGITNKESFQKACEYANGAIVGTAFVKLLANDDYMARIPEFVKSIRD